MFYDAFLLKSCTFSRRTLSNLGARKQGMALNISCEHVPSPPCRYSTLPVVILESRSPIGRPEQRLQHTGQVDEPITHQKEPVDNIDLNENNNEHRLLRGLEDAVDVQR